MKKIKRYKSFMRELSESNEESFKREYFKDLKYARGLILKINKKLDKIESSDDHIWDKLEKAMSKYDKNVGSQIESWAQSGRVEIDAIIRLAINNERRYGTEPQFIIEAIEDYAKVLNIS